MKTIKNLTVTVTYQVGLGNVEVPDKVYDELVDSFESGANINPCSVYFLEAADWLSNNIREKDCSFWEVEIDNIE